MKINSFLVPLAVLFASVAWAPATAEVVRIAHVDAFSGPASALNKNFDNTLRYSIDLANANQWAGRGITFEAVDFDGKNSVQDSLLQLKNATDQGIRYVFQGGSSSIALALIDAVNRHNERNPSKEVLIINPTGQAAELTNEKCSFWSFNFDANTNMRSEGLTALIEKNKSIRKVYLINQNYSLGQQTSSSIKRDLKRKRPDIEIVGDDLHPMLQVKDFTPYVAKIRASGADVIITANFSADLVLLLKAMKEAALNLPMYTYNAGTTGGPTALAAAGVENVKLLAYWVPNDNISASRSVIDAFRAKYNDDFALVPWYNAIRMLAQAIKDAKSTETLAVARALEGMKINSLNGEIEMRKSDHQLLQQLLIADWTKVDGKSVVYDLEKTGYGFKVIDKIPPYVAATPTSCEMKRPA